jgi:hypothetical protein
MSKEHATRVKRPSAKRRGGVRLGRVHDRAPTEVKTLADTRIYLPDMKPGPLARKLVKALKTLQA